MSKHESAIICIALILSGIVFYIGKSYGLLNIVWVFLPLFAIVWIRLVVMNIDVLYYSFIASLFVSRPLVNLFPITIVLPDLLFILLMAHQLYIYNKNAVWYDFHKKVGIPLFLLCMAALLSVFLNVVAGYRPIVIATGFWSVWRLAQVLLLYMIFSAKNVTRLSLEKVMILFGVMLLIQLVFIAAGYNGTFFSHHASMGTFMFLPIFLSVGVLYKKHISVWLKCNAAVVFVLAFIVHLLSESRSAFAGIGLGLMLIGFRMHLKNIRSVLLFVGILFGISYLLLNTPLGGILDKTFKDGGQLDISSLSRFVIWESAWKFWLNQDLLHKLFGTGITFSRELLPIPFLHGGDRFIPSAHNNYLTTLVETGVFGFLVFISLYVNILLMLFKRYTATKSPVILAYFCMFVGVLFSNMGQESLWTHAFNATFVMGIFVFLPMVMEERADDSLGL